MRAGLAPSICIAATLSGPLVGGREGDAEHRAPTFAADVAPIVYRRCTPCHHEGGPGPFALVSHEDVRRRAKQIAIVTGSRFMPPWKAEPGHRELLDSRRLSSEELTTLADWAAAGAPLGEPKELPPPPVPETEWALGEPDLVLRMSEDFVLPREGLDVYRSFVVPTGFAEDRYVRATDLRTTNPRVLHHVFVLLDTEGKGRKADALDPGPGFQGMEALTEGLFGTEIHVWTPGTEAHFLPRGAAWLLPTQVDVVLDTHWQTTGKSESCTIELGFYFADEAPEKHLTNVSIEGPPINIPPDHAEVVVEQRFLLPVDSSVLGVQPHAHYAARDVVVDATPPGGPIERLIHVADWDFNWQHAYRFVEPLELPAGSEVFMRFVYDNSEANRNNPYYPRRRILSGPRSADEMALLWLQVLTAEEDHERLVAYEEEVREATLAENEMYRALFQGILYGFDADRDQVLDAEEEAAATAYVNGLRQHRHVAAFDLDANGRLDARERAFLETAIELWNGGSP